MNRLVICVAFVGISVIGNYAMGQDENLPTIVSTLENKYLNLQLEQDQMEVKVKSLLGRDADLKQQLLQLQKDNAEQQSAIDSLHTKIAQLSVTQSNDRTTFNEQIEKMNTNVQANETSLYQRTLWGGLIGLGAILVLIVALYLLSQRLKKGHSSIEEMKEAQAALLSAQTKLQEESVKLDNKLLEVIGKQIATTPTLSVSDSAKPDYSLVLKVADEIVRIEMNLSRMDASVKGYKQLAKAVQRIKDNFQANGYEIVDMLGKSYNAGMKVIANFVVDETLEQGQQVITGIIKPQINFNGTMIQSAQITVSQNI